VTANLDEARRQWLSELYEAHAGSVFAQCQRLLNSAEDAADATQEVFIRAASSLSEPANSSEASRWLTTVARNYCIDVIRRRERFGSALVTLAATPGAVGETIESVEDRQLVLAVLERMGARERQALVQSAVEDLPVAEVARTSGLSYLAAAQLLHRARRSALLILTRLVVILGLAQLGRAAKRLKLVQNSHQLAAVVALPLAVAVAVVATSPSRTIPVKAGAASTHSSAVAQQPLSPVHTGSPPGTSPAPAPTPGATSVAPSAPARTGAVLSEQVLAVKPTPRPPALTQPNAPATDERDHGKGRDNDDRTKKPKKH
jgi:RNA polymerase sigma-70 factor, ECF subfamily